MLSIFAIILSTLAIGLQLFPGVGLWLQGTLSLPSLEQNDGRQVETPSKPPTPINSNPITQPFSSLIADVAESLAPSVVNIDVSIQSQMNQQVPDIFRYFFGDNAIPQQQQYPQSSQGSGVIYRADKGYIITNFHVVGRATQMTVTLDDGSKHEATLIGGDPMTDLAVIQIKPKGVNLKEAKVGDSKRLRPGDWTLAIGSPLGFDHTVTLGIVSAISRYVPGLNEDVKFIQTDAAINPGNSGGPLVNIYGEVIGINTAIAGKGQNIGFAIPSDTVKSVIDELIAKGKIERPYVGIALGELTPQLAKSLGIPEDTKGAVVVNTVVGSPASQAGLQQGDIIQRIDGQQVDTAKAVQDRVRKETLGHKFNMQILRGKQMLGVSLTSELMQDQAFSQGQ